MSREKQIEEMAKVVAEVQYLGGLEEKVAEHLYNAGYRNQLEFSGEIFDEISAMCIDVFGNFNHKKFSELKRKYKKGKN